LLLETNSLAPSQSQSPTRNPTYNKYVLFLLIRDWYRGQAQTDREMGSLLAYGGVDDLADGEGYHGALAGAGLGLGDDVTAVDDGEYGALLDGGGLLEAVVVDAAEELVLDAHLVEAADDLDPRRGLEGEVLVVHVAAAAGAAPGGGRRRRHCRAETLEEEGSSRAGSREEDFFVGKRIQ
jgi:hypothetical protein